MSCSRFNLLLIETVTEKSCSSNQFLQYIFFLIPVKTELRLLRGIYHCSLAGHLEYICSACCQGLNSALLLLKLHSMFWTKVTGCRISCHPRSYTILEIRSAFFYGTNESMWSFRNQQVHDSAVSHWAANGIKWYFIINSC